MKSLWLSRKELPPKRYLIVGLGNPGTAYEKTRHNIGFRAVQEFAKKHGMTFRKESRVYGELAEGQVEGNKVLLLLPMTYMNNSGRSVQACMSYFKLGLEDMIVVVDDIAFALGDFRVKKEGSPGGHNGLKSIEEHLKSSSYFRLRIGIGAPNGQILADYVLDKFPSADHKTVEQVLQRVSDALDCWIYKKIERLEK